MAYVAMVFGFGPAMAPIIGGWIATALGVAEPLFHVGRNQFSFGGGLPRVAAGKPSKSEPYAGETFRSLVGYARTITNAWFLTGCIALGVAFLGQGVFIAGAADWCVNVMHFAPSDFWKLFIPMISGVVLGSFISARAAHRWGTPMTIRVSFMIMTAGAALAAFEILCVTEPVMPIAVLPLVVYTTGLGMVRPGMSLLLMDTFPQSRGLASSVLNFIQTLAFALCSAVVVPVLYGKFAAYDAALIVFCLSAMVLWYVSTVLHLKSNRRADLAGRSRSVD